AAIPRGIIGRRARGPSARDACYLTSRCARRSSCTAGAALLPRARRGRARRRGGGRRARGGGSAPRVVALRGGGGARGEEPLLNGGRGSSLQADGVARMDASLMSSDGRAGAL